MRLFSAVFMTRPVTWGLRNFLMRCWPVSRTRLPTSASVLRHKNRTGTHLAVLSFTTLAEGLSKFIIAGGTIAFYSKIREKDRWYNSEWTHTHTHWHTHTHTLTHTHKHTQIHSHTYTHTNTHTHSHTYTHTHSHIHILSLSRGGMKQVTVQLRFAYKTSPFPVHQLSFLHIPCKRFYYVIWSSYFRSFVLATPMSLYTSPYSLLFLNFNDCFLCLGCTRECAVPVNCLCSPALQPLYT
jgi:hypothetical protein